MIAMTPSPEGVRTINHQKESSMAKPKSPALKYSYDTSATRSDPYHFYASSVAEWKTDTDLDKLIAFMKKAGFPFNLFKVPLPADAEYKINNYSPMVPDCVFIGYWGFPEE